MVDDDTAGPSHTVGSKQRRHGACKEKEHAAAANTPKHTMGFKWNTKRECLRRSKAAGERWAQRGDVYTGLKHWSTVYPRMFSPTSPSWPLPSPAAPLRKAPLSASFPDDVLSNLYSKHSLVHAVRTMDAAEVLASPAPAPVFPPDVIFGPEIADAVSCLSNLRIPAWAHVSAF